MKREQEIREMLERLDKEMDSLIHRIVNSPSDTPQSELDPIVKKLISTVGKIDALRWVLGDRDDLL